MKKKKGFEERESRSGEKNPVYLSLMLTLSLTRTHHTLSDSHTYRSLIVPPTMVPSSLLRVISSVAFRAVAAGEAPCQVEQPVMRWPYQERSF